jgi:hypothetical protein
VVRIVHPEIEMAKAAEAINNMLSTIIGALVGFISGRAYGRREEREQQNGEQNKPRPIKPRPGQDEQDMA